MEKYELREGEECIILYATVPDCRECEARIINLLTGKPWLRVEIGLRGTEGTPVALVYEKNADCDFWRSALRAKELLQRYGYRVL